MQPIPSLEDGVIGTESHTTVQRAATMVTASMTGISISSPVLAPTRGTTHSVRICIRLVLGRVILMSKLIDPSAFVVEVILCMGA